MGGDCARVSSTDRFRLGLRTETTAGAGLAMARDVSGVSSVFFLASLCLTSVASIWLSGGRELFVAEAVGDSKWRFRVRRGGLVLPDFTVFLGVTLLGRGAQGRSRGEDRDVRGGDVIGSVPKSWEELRREVRSSIASTAERPCSPLAFCTARDTVATREASSIPKPIDFMMRKTSWSVGGEEFFPISRRRSIAALSRPQPHAMSFSMAATVAATKRSLAAATEARLSLFEVLLGLGCEMRCRACCASMEGGRSALLWLPAAPPLMAVILTVLIFSAL